MNTPFALALCLLTACTAHAQTGGGISTFPAPANPAAAPGQPTPTAEPLPETPKLPTVDAVLSLLENADKDLRSLSAALVYIKRAPAIEGGGTQIRYGTLQFNRATEPAAPPTPPAPGGQPRTLQQFAIDFDQLVVDGRARNDRQTFVFDGRYLLETFPTQKQYIRRHIVGPDQVRNPLRIGEGPFPIPVGQRKADLLARFDVSVAAPLADAPTSDQLRRILFNCTQLVLVPKPGTDQAKAFKIIRLWYRTTDMLPIFALTVSVDGSSNEVFLNDIIKNPALPPGAFNTTPPSAADGWAGEEQDLRDATIAPGSPFTAPGPKPDPTPPAQPK